MIVVFILVAAIALISLYDYFNTRSWQQVTSDVRNNAVFEKRNRAYGAYAVRRDYDKRFMVIILGMVGGAGILFAATRNGVIEEKLIIPESKTIEYIVELEKEDKPVVEPLKTAPQQAQAATTVFVEPIIVDRDPITPITIPDPGTPVGLVVNPGTDPFGGTGPVLPVGPGGGTVIGTPDPPKGPEMYVDEMAEFPGGNDKLAPYLRDHVKYPQIAQELGLQGKCHTQFVVNTAGDISEVTVKRGVPDCKECDKEAVKVINAMPRWKPAKKNGKTVASYYNLPIVFKLANN